MSSFENTLARMKDLYTYGKELNESNKTSVHTLEHSAKAADGVTYGIIRECNKYYIKSAAKGKETVAESYDYLGGICNKKNYEYTSYSNALKNFELKMASINEACDSKVNISTLDPFKKEEFIIECTDKMKNEIARQRQIMYNAAMLMNESTEIGASRKNDVVMYDGKNPEAETGKKGCEDLKNTNANPEYKGSKTNGVDKKVAPFDENAPKCEDQLKENCECGSDSCDCKDDWASDGIGKGRDPKQIGWDVDGQQKVNEEEEDWASKGLPSTPGVGEADTDHNNMPFDKTVNEEEDIDVDTDVDMIDGDTETDVEVDDEASFDDEGSFDDETDIDFGVEDDEFGDEEMNFDDDMDSEIDTELNGEMEMGDDVENDDIMSQIEDLQAQIDALKAKLEGGESIETDVDTEELGDEESFDDVDSEEGFEEESFDDESLSDEESFDEEGLDNELDAENEDEFGDDFDGEGNFDEEDMISESKRKAMDKIIETVVNKLLKEDELHAFGKHPGYQKKPMELPSTGEDKNQWGEDWNDESVYSEEPFGTKIGDSTPFDKVVDAIHKKVMEKLSESVKNDKKKVK